MLARKITRATVALCVFGIAAFGFIGCGNDTGGEVRLQGAGASFPNPLYQKWLSEYGKLNPHVKIDYQSIGSGGGIKQIQARTVDFGASDAPMKDDDLKAAPGEILHIPTVLGAVVITYDDTSNEPVRVFQLEHPGKVFTRERRWVDLVPRLARVGLFPDDAAKIAEVSRQAAPPAAKPAAR